MMAITTILASCAFVLALLALVLAAMAYRQSRPRRQAPARLRGPVPEGERGAQAGGPADSEESPADFLDAFTVARAEAPGALLVIDGDQFSNVSGELDAAAMAEALDLIERAIRAAIRPDDVVGRIDGHRFAVFLRGADPAFSRSIAERIRETVEDTIFMSAEGQIARLSVSVGGVSTSAATPESEIARATRNLEHGRDAGGSRIVVSN